MRIDQCSISSGVKFFGDKFKERWDLKSYYSTEAPCIFFGCYQDSDVTRIKNHKGLKIITFTGSDVSNILKFEKEDHINVISDIIINWDQFKDLKNYGLSKFLRVPVKDYSTFTPVPLGDKIYAYQGRPEKSFHEHYKKTWLDEVIRYFGKDKVIVGYQGSDIEFVKENYYKECFVNLQFNPMSGLTTLNEMAHMGRRSISNYPAPFCLSFQNIKDVLVLIERERDNHLSPNIVGRMAREYMFIGDGWLDTNFWKS